MKDQIKILLIGDTGTGKSSVISSYISKYFPHEVPAVLVDAIIPPESTADNVSVTIMDSSALLGDRDVLHQKIRMADSIISLFDVTRPETIDSLEELWLPTIRELCGTATVSKAVIVVGNKTDLIHSADEIAQLEAEKSRMNKILEDFPFVVACYRCSAKLIEVDQMFYESELAVTFPVGPLFDTTKSEFTASCKIAFCRIFRCFDSDQDGLLLDSELNDLQQQSFGVPLKDDEMIAIKQEICKSVPGGMQNESITFKGLMGIMRLFIYRGQQQTPWTMLARFGYEDRLFTLEIPTEIEEEQETCEGESFELSSAAFNFLHNLAINTPLRRYQDDGGDDGSGNDSSQYLRKQENFPSELNSSHENNKYNFNGNKNGRMNGDMNKNMISWGDLGEILSVMPTVSHPWSYPPICQDEYDRSLHIFLLSGGSAPPLLSPSALNSMADSGLYSSWLQPTVDTKSPRDDVVVGLETSVRSVASAAKHTALSKAQSNADFCSIDDWMAQWQMLAMHRPVLVQTLLYHMGYVEREDLGLCVVTRPQCDSIQPKRVVNVCILGGAGVGKADLVRAMSNLAAQTVFSNSPLVSVNNDGLMTGSYTGSGSGSGFFYGDSDVAEIESEGYPLHVLKVGYDCDVEDEERGGVEGLAGEYESSYVHGSCSHAANTRVSIVFTAVPYDRAVEWIDSHADSCDVAVFVLDCREALDQEVDFEGVGEEKETDETSYIEVVVSDGRNQATNLKSTSPTSIKSSLGKSDRIHSAAKNQNIPKGSKRQEEVSSLLAAQRLESLLPKSLPRLFVVNRSDLLFSKSSSTSHIPSPKSCTADNGTPGNNRLTDSETIKKSLIPACEYVRRRQLLPLLYASTVTGEGINELKNAILRVSSNPNLGIPIGSKGRLINNEFKWLAGKVFCAVVTVALIASAIVLGRDNSSHGGKDNNEDGHSNNFNTGPYRYFSWMRRAMMRVLGTTSQGD